MKLYVVKGNQLETGTFESFEGETVRYHTKDGLKAAHIQNVFFNEKNARYQQMRVFGIVRPILNGTSS